MRKFLAAIAVSVLLSAPALAFHLGPPIVGKERNESVWMCKTADDAKLWYATQQFKDQGLSPSVWRDHIIRVRNERRCTYIRVTYKVVNVLEITEAPAATEEGWGEDVTFYLIETVSPITGKPYYLSTN